MRQINEVKNKTMKGVSKVKVLDGKSIQIYFKNGEDIILESKPLDYGYDSGIFITKDNIHRNDYGWEY